MKASEWVNMVEHAIQEHGDLELLIREGDGRVQVMDPKITKVPGAAPCWMMTVSGHDFPEPTSRPDGHYAVRLVDRSTWGVAELLRGRWSKDTLSADLWEYREDEIIVGNRIELPEPPRKTGNTVLDFDAEIAFINEHFSSEKKPTTA